MITVTTLLIVQKELNSLKEDVDSEITNRIDEFLINFFSNLNSAKNSYLLDTTELVLNDLLDENSQINRDFKYCKKTLEIIIRILSNFFKFNNVTPIEEVNSLLIVNQKEINSYEIENYSENFKHTKSTSLKARVVAPGWKINDHIISKPKIQLEN